MRALLPSRAPSIGPDLPLSARPLPRSPAVVVALLTFGLVLGSATQAAAHSVPFSIWAYGIDIWSPQENHYHREPYCPSCGYDYMQPTEELVHQDVAGNFDWLQLRLRPGNVFSADAFKGSMYLLGASGEIARSDGHFCRSVREEAYYFVYLSNGGATGYWQQVGGGGSINCYLAYTSDADNMVVFGQQ